MIFPAYAQSDQSLCSSLEYSMIVKLLTEHNLEFLSLKGGCTGSSESTLAKCRIVGNLMPQFITELHSLIHCHILPHFLWPAGSLSAQPPLAYMFDQSCLY